MPMYEIRPAEDKDIKYLPDVEISAASVFLSKPEYVSLYQDDCVSIETHLEYLQGWRDLHIGPGGIFVAVAHDERGDMVSRDEGQNVGFVLTKMYPATHSNHDVESPSPERILHISEIDVHFDHQGRGLARRLLAAVMDCAEQVSRNETAFRLTGISLTTLRDVPFNGPFYAQLGFRVLKDEEEIAKFAGIEGVDILRDDLFRLASQSGDELQQQRCFMFCPIPKRVSSI